MQLTEIPRRKLLALVGGASAAVGTGVLGSDDDTERDAGREAKDADAGRRRTVDDVTVAFENCSTLVIEDAPDEADSVDVTVTYYSEDGIDTHVLPCELDELPERIDANGNEVASRRLSIVAVRAVEVYDDENGTFHTATESPLADRCIALARLQFLLWQAVHGKIGRRTLGKEAKRMVDGHLDGKLHVEMKRDGVVEGKYDPDD